MEVATVATRGTVAARSVVDTSAITGQCYTQSTQTYPHSNLRITVTRNRSFMTPEIIGPQWPAHHSP